MSADPQLPRVGDLIDRGKYRIDAVIGEGGMGVVFAATHMQMGDKRRAIKWLLPKLARDDAAVRRFLAEANIAARIDHPNVVSPIDVSVDLGAPYIVMELLEGETLGDYLGDQALSVEKAGRIFMPILQGVAAAHDQNIVHRDLKPGNIFLARWSGEGRIPKVLDFGIAKVLDARRTQDTLTNQGALLGTIQYMSPEQLHDASRVGPQADVYALGVILYRMLSAKLPYEGNLLDLALRIREGRPARLTSHVGSVPAGLEEAVMRALAPALDQRFPDVRSFAAALSPFFGAGRLDFGPSLRPAGPSPISELPQAQPAHAGEGGEGGDPSEAARAATSASKAFGAASGRENSTFHPVSTPRARASMAPRTFLVVGGLGLLAAGGLIALAWPSAEDAGATAVEPDVPEQPPNAGQPPAAAGAAVAAAAPTGKPDAGEAAIAAPGWDDLGGALPPDSVEAEPVRPPAPPVQEPRAQRADAPQRSSSGNRGARPPKVKRPRAAEAEEKAGSLKPSVLDTILEQNDKRLDTILGSSPAER